MNVLEKIGDWAKGNPILAGVALFGIGLVLLYLLGYLGGGNGASSGGAASSDIASYYAAASAQDQANAAVQVAQQQGQTQLQLATLQQPLYQQAIAANENVALNTNSAAVNLGTVQTNAALQALSLTAAEQQQTQAYNLFNAEAIKSYGGTFDQYAALQKSVFPNYGNPLPVTLAPVAGA